MSLQILANVALGYTQTMDNLAISATENPDIVKDPGKLAAFQTQMFYAESGYELTSKTIQDIHKEDQTLSDMLRDA
jgi:hypothetical protein